MTDYQQLDAELDEELRAVYAPNSESDDAASTDSPVEEAGNESEDTTPVDETVVEDATTPETPTDATEELVPKSQYKEAVRAMNRAQEEAAKLRKEMAAIRDTEGQREDLLRQLQAEIEQLKQAPSQSTEAPESNQAPQAVDDDDLKEAQEYYPEVVNPLLKMIATLKNELAAIKGEFGTVKHVAERYQAQEQKSAEQQHVEAILSAHPDAAEIANSDAYAEWYTQQPQYVQAALTQGTAADVVAMLHLFKAAHPEYGATTGTVSTRPKADKLAAAKQAAAPSVKGVSQPNTKPKFTREAIAKMSTEEFREYEAEIDKALANGELY